MLMDDQDYRELVQLVAHEQRKTHAAAWFTTGEEHLRLTVRNSLASVRAVLRGRFLGVDGEIRSLEESLTPATDRTPTSATFALGQGFLLNAHLLVTGAAPRRGQTLALLELVRGIGGDVVPLATLLADYLTDTQRIAWPGSPIRHSTEAPGVIRSITGTDPAAGADTSDTVPTDARWRLLAFHATLVTDATAANREASLIADDGTNNLVWAPSTFTHVASVTRRYTWADLGAVLTPTQQTVMAVPFPSIVLSGGFRLRTGTQNLQAGDNWGAPQLLVEEWIED